MKIVLGQPIILKRKPQPSSQGVSNFDAVMAAGVSRVYPAIKKALWRDALYYDTSIAAKDAIRLLQEAGAKSEMWIEPPHFSRIHVATKEGNVYAAYGDWLVISAEGEVYVRDSATFEAEYDVVMDEEEKKE